MYVSRHVENEIRFELRIVVSGLGSSYEGHRGHELAVSRA